jgi:hypothetical protein
MDKKCFIVEDLLPLYNEQLLKEETKHWIEEHLRECESCCSLSKQVKRELPKENLSSSSDSNLILKKVNRRLSSYQIIFVALSFFFAVKTSMLNSSFEFVLWYTVLGLITYLFYKDVKIVFLLAFIPIFLWSVGESVLDYTSGNYDKSVSFISFLLSCIMGAVFTSLIHYIFSVIGSVIGMLIEKIMYRGEE